jgi:hypothetical protein
MAKVNGPLLSLDAQKTIGKTLTFQRRPSGHAVYLFSKPGSVKKFTPSADQLTQRDNIKLLVESWQALSSAEKHQWDIEAQNAHYVGTGYHYFIHLGQNIYYLLLESGGFLLLESGGKIIL